MLHPGCWGDGQILWPMTGLLGQNRADGELLADHDTVQICVCVCVVAQIATVGSQSVLNSVKLCSPQQESWLNIDLIQSFAGQFLVKWAQHMKSQKCFVANMFLRHWRIINFLCVSIIYWAEFSVSVSVMLCSVSSQSSDTPRIKVKSPFLS